MFNSQCTTLKIKFSFVFKDWLVDQHQLIDNPAPMTTVQTIRKILQSGKKVRHWDDTNIIDYLAPPPPGATYKLKTNCIAP